MFALTALQSFALLLSLILLLVYLTKQIPFYVLSARVPGPFALPLVGCAFRFANKKPEQLLETIDNLSRSYPTLVRFWLGTKFILGVKDAENARVVLSSNRMNSKAGLYRLMEPFLGEGLISGSGKRWKEHKKVIVPLLNGDFIGGTLEAFRCCSAEMLDVLEKQFMGKGLFNVETVVQKYIADVLAIRFLGVDTKSRTGENAAFLKAPKEFYELINHRGCKPWLQPDALFKLTKWHKLQEQLIQDLDNVILKAIENSKSRVKMSTIADDCPIIDKLVQKMLENPDVMTDEELAYQLKTLYVASEDTMVNLSSIALMLLGMYSDHQEKIVKELKTGSHTHLMKCIKEALRLFPAGPFIFRETVDHFQIANLILPPKCTVLINIWAIHRDPEQWQHPNQFYPNHFEPSAISDRHPTSFIPFSSGGRGCIGKALSYPLLILIISTILEKFVVEAEGDVASIKLKSDVTVRATEGYNIRIKPRSATES